MSRTDRVSFKQPSLPGTISIGILLVVMGGLVTPSLAQTICRPPTSTQPGQNSDRTAEILTIPNSTTLNAPDSGVLQPPLPEEQMKAAANVELVGGKINVMLKNNTNAPLTYQVMGHTSTRTLLGRKAVVLQDLPAPVTINMNRNDGGLLVVTPAASDRPGMLNVTLDGTNTLSSQQSTISINNVGQVLLN
ncbi:MAG: hypothetical protein KME17_22020 [Cyanosarcina radialis HA8281-LM2]|jgi:hypothetical protein|nr:hypothetical protein [Cyanosarcina radialis HA8281-LM2]